MSANNFEKTQTEQTTTQWDELKDFDKQEEERERQIKEFTARELERLAKITGRTSDDESIIKLNLVLRYDTYQLLKKTVQESQQRHIMVQQGTMEDLATAKRELEEAMYLYDGTFAKDDVKTEDLNEQQHRADTKDRLRDDKHYGEGEATTGNSWVKAHIERSKEYDKKRDAVSEHREAAAQRMTDELDDLAVKFKQEVIGNENLWETYQLNKEDEPRVKDRRLGFDGAGKNGLYGSGKYPSSDIDWTLYPHASEQPAEHDQGNNAPNTPETPDEPDNPDAPDEPENPDEPDTEEEEDENPVDNTPLVAINADFTHDKRELAQQFAEQELNEELTHSNFLKRIWKGSLFRKYYQRKYESEIFTGERKLDLEGDNEDVKDIIDDRSGSAIKRFVLGATEDYEGYIHTRAGESLTEADARTTEIVKSAVEWFAEAAIPEGGSIKDLEVEFGNRIGRLRAESHDQEQPINDALINNYLEVAIQARERVEHEVAIEDVMEGFKVYNADVRGNVRSEVHRDNIDKIVDRIENSRIGQVVPIEIVSAVLGTAYGLTQTGARAIAGPLAGIGVSALVAGLKERNRVTEDRARMMRDIASGDTYSGLSDGENNEGRTAKKRAKYEARIGGTLYDMRPASALTENLEQAYAQLASGEGTSESLLQAIAEARVRVDFSDSENKDLISYSSGDQIGDERLALDAALIRAEKSLSDEDKTRLAEMKQAIQSNIEESVDENDQEFRHIRTVQALKQSGKVVALGTAFFFGSQEIAAAISPNKIGLFEKMGLLKTENADNAQETILAGLAGPRTQTQVIENISGDNTAEIQRYRDAGFEQVETQAGWNETRTDLVDVNPSDSTHQVNAIYDGWANNGTVNSDGNELRIYQTSDGRLYSGMHGISTMGGESFNYDDLAANGQIRGYLTVGGAKFEIIPSIGDNGELIWGDGNGVFTTTTGETIRAIGDNGEELFQYFEVAANNGVDADGFTHIMPFATEVGANTFDSTIQQVTETTIEHPAVYEFVKEIPRDVYLGGVAFPPAVSRTGLGAVRRANPAPQPEVPPAETERTPAAPETDNENPPDDTGEATGTTGETANTERANLINTLRGEFANDPADETLRESLIEMMSNPPAARDYVDYAGMTALWIQLSPETQAKVRNFESGQTNSAYGQDFRNFLNLFADDLSRPQATAATEDTETAEATA